jgi:RNA polymerase sigma-70 factor (ECF subfamily)
VEAVVRAYHARLVGFLRLFTRERELAEDIAQEVFLLTYRHREKIRGVAQLQPWLFTLARREALRELKRLRYSAEVRVDDEALVDLSGGVEGEQHRGLLEGDLKGALLAALGELKPRDREILVLRFFYDLPLKEIADITGIPIGSLGVFLRRALDRTKAILERDGYGFEELTP